MSEHYKYQKLEKVGEGTYGQVYKGKNRKTGEVVALKMISLESLDEGIPSTAIREISLLKQLEHPNVVRLHDVVHTMGELALVFEFVDQDLSELIRDRSLSPFSIKSFMFQLLLGLQYCHNNKVLHRDLKPSNLLINLEGELKLADFGLAIAFAIPLRTYRNEVVTLWYRAPEILLGSTSYDTSVDMWSVGCIFVEMVTGKAPFYGNDNPSHFLKMIEALGTPTLDDWKDMNKLSGYRKDFPVYPKQSIERLVPGLCAEGVDLLRQMFHYDPSQRIHATAALMHPFPRSFRNCLADRDMELRVLRDTEEISALELASYPAEEAASPATLAKRHGLAPDYTLGAYLHDELVGFLCGTLTSSSTLTHESMESHEPLGETLCIHSVVVSPLYRRRGYATAMLKLYLSRVSVPCVLLVTKAYLIPLYKAAGFSLLGKSSLVHGKDQWYEMRFISP